MNKTCKVCVHSAIYKSPPGHHHPRDGELICTNRLPDLVIGERWNVNQLCHTARYQGACGPQGTYWSQRKEPI